jgi:uncharacterized protein
MEKSNFIQIVWNITHDCNMACTYCYYNEEMNSKPGTMNLELVETLLKNLAASSFQKIKFSFHGGEPLTIGLEYFKKIINLQKTLLKEKDYINTIQTNGTLLSYDFLQFAKENNLQIGISLDGPKEIHDNYRFYKDGSGTFDSVFKNINILCKNDIKYNVFAVCNDLMASNIDKVYAFFKSLEGLHGMDFILPNSRGRNILTQNNLSYILVNIFDKWVNDSKCSFDIRILKTITLNLLNIPQFLCTFINGCAINFPVISIDPYGNVYPCDSNVMLYQLGNIRTDKMEYFLFNNRQRQKLNRLDLARIEKCRFCKWYRYCNGGCPNNHETNGIVNYYCTDLKNIFIHIETTLKEMSILDDYNIIQVNHVNNIKNRFLKNKINEIYKNDSCNKQLRVLSQ